MGLTAATATCPWGISTRTATSCRGQVLAFLRRLRVIMWLSRCPTPMSRTGREYKRASGIALERAHPLRRRTCRKRCVAMAPFCRLTRREILSRTLRLRCPTISGPRAPVSRGAPTITLGPWPFGPCATSYEKVSAIISRLSTAYERTSRASFRTTYTPSSAIIAAETWMACRRPSEP